MIPSVTGIVNDLVPWFSGKYCHIRLPKKGNSVNGEIDRISDVSFFMQQKRKDNLVEFGVSFIFFYKYHPN